jgi:DNA-binding winged helix-turn-helix (wHTH) protein/tetratricopeptide (TPR) repeat protein
VVYLFETYRLDEENFSLTQDGRRVALEPKALRVLLVLVSSEGRLLEKKVLLETVWKDTFVEESTLTRAVAVLRKSLGDDPRSPRFIETVPTLGYRFIASVRIEGSGLEAIPEAVLANGIGTAEPEAPANLTEEPVPENLGEHPTQRELSPRRWTPFYTGGAAVVVVLVAIFAGLRLSHRTKPSLGAKDTIVLADFTNTSGDQVFDDIIRQGMTVQLEQSPVLHLASDGTIRKTLRLMGKSPNAPLTPDLGREICQRVGGAAILDGSISRVGAEYVLGLRARNCETGELLDVEQAQVDRTEDVLEALSRIATRFRTRVGESVASIKSFDTPLAEATTSSLDALKAFSQAIRLFNTTGSGQALPLFKRATELDPEFAMAHVWLGRMYADFEEGTLSIESTTRAYQLRERASDRERFSIDVSYDLLVSGDLVKARETCEAWVHMYPGDPYPHAFLSGSIYPAFGQYEKASAEAKRTIEIDPDFVVGYRNLILNWIALNRLQDAEGALRQASDRKLYLGSFVTDKYRIAFLRGDRKGMKRALEEAPTNPWLMNYEALTLARSGDLTSAREISGRAVNTSKQASRHDTQAQLEVASALLEAFYGDPRLARKLALDALGLSKGKNIEFDVAYVLAIIGDSAQAARLTEELAGQFRDDTIVQYSYVPQLQALIALNHNQPQKALDLIKVASPYDLSQPPYPIYIRGKALLAMGQATEAATEFQKIIDHPGLVMNDPIALLARLELGRSYALLGNKVMARVHYESLLNLLKDADATIALFKQAQMEYARL